MPVNNFTMSDKGIKFLKEREGIIVDKSNPRFALAYQDSVDIWTIGYGHTGFVDNHQVKEGLRISLDKAELVLKADLKRFETAINRAVKVPLLQHQFDALVSLAFNIGEGAFLRSTLLKLLNANKKKEAAAEFLKWRMAGGKVLQGLVKRRELEKRIFEFGIY